MKLHAVSVGHKKPLCTIECRAAFSSSNTDGLRLTSRFAQHMFALFAVMDEILLGICVLGGRRVQLTYLALHVLYVQR